MFLKTSKFFLYISLFSVLIVMPSTFFPFIGGKDYLFRFSVELALASLLLFWGFEAEAGELRRRIREVFRKPLFVAVSLFALMFLLAVAFAYDRHAAFWSNYERGEGGFQMIHYYLFFLLLTLLFREERDWRAFFRAILVVAVLMVGYGLASAALLPGFVGSYAQATAPTFFGRLFSSAARFQGSLGNPSYVAPYLIFSLFYGLYLWASSRSGRGRTILYALLTVLFAAFIILTGTRGSFLGLGAAIFVFLSYLVFLRPTWRKRLVAFLVLFVVGMGTMVYFRHTNFVRGLPGGRVFEIGLGERTVQTRLWTWGSAWKGFLERPLVGWGPENFSTVFDKYFDPRHYVPNMGTETWFDRAHSVFFDYLAETGVVGLASYLGIFAVFYYELFRRLGSRENSSVRPQRTKREQPSDERRLTIQRALLAALPVGYLVQGLVLFDVLPIYINLFTFLAFSCFYFYHTHGEHS